MEDYYFEEIGIVFEEYGILRGARTGGPIETVETQDPYAFLGVPSR